MPTTTANGVQLFYQRTGDSGPPLVLVHGAWGDHTVWDGVVPALAQRFRVLTYDRRGHAQSERPPTQGSAAEDAADLAALIVGLGLAPAHVVGTSFGAIVALRLAIRRPDLVRSLIVHEPPLMDLPLADPAAAQAAQTEKARIEAIAARLAAGDLEGGARDFVDTVVSGPGTWDTFPPERQRVRIERAPTFLDEVRDPDAYTLDLDALATCRRPVLLTYGEQDLEQDLPFFKPIVVHVAAALPQAETRLIEGAGHGPHVTHPDAHVAVITAFAEAADTGAG